MYKVIAHEYTSTLIYFVFQELLRNRLVPCGQYLIEKFVLQCIIVAVHKTTYAVHDQDCCIQPLLIIKKTLIDAEDSTRNSAVTRRDLLGGRDDPLY